VLAGLSLRRWVQEIDGENLRRWMSVYCRRFVVIVTARGCGRRWKESCAAVRVAEARGMAETNHICGIEMVVCGESCSSTGLTGLWLIWRCGALRWQWRGGQWGLMDLCVDAEFAAKLPTRRSWRELLSTRRGKHDHFTSLHFALDFISCICICSFRTMARG
jgi:hypothetical protein